MAGVMCGAIFFPTLADRFGRKVIHLSCLFSMIAIGVIIALAPNYITFVALRFFQGAVRPVSEPLCYKIFEYFYVDSKNWG